MSEPTTRCTACRTEFTDAQLEGQNRCPTCGTVSLPMAIKDDVTIRINWHELRILGMWADNWAQKFCPDEAKRSIRAILGAIAVQHPGRSALTMGEELQEVADAFGDLTVTDSDGTTAVKGHKPS